MEVSKRNSYNNEILDNFLQHSKMLSYPLYEVQVDDELNQLTFNEESGKKYQLMIAEKDLDEKLKVGGQVYQYNFDDDLSGKINMVIITDELVEEIQSHEVKYVEHYILKRIIFPDIFIDVKKFIEYETTLHIVKILSDICSFDFQVNIHGKFIDNLIVIHNKYLIDIPRIVIEIDEDGHVDYDETKDSGRTKLIEQYAKILRIPIMRKDVLKNVKKNTSEEDKWRIKTQNIQTIVVPLVEAIKQEIKDILVTYCEDITEENLLKRISGQLIDMNLIKLFCKRNIDQFTLSIEEVGTFLEYSETSNYRHMRELMDNVLVYGRHFIEVSKEDYSKRFPKDLIVGGPTGWFKNLGGSGKNKKFICISRSGFNILAINSSTPKARLIKNMFCDVYEASMQLIVLRMKSISGDRLKMMNNTSEILKIRDKNSNNDLLKKDQEIFQLQTQVKTLTIKSNEDNERNLKAITLLEENRNNIKVKYDKLYEENRIDVNDYNKLVKEYNKLNETFDELDEKYEEVCKENKMLKKNMNQSQSIVNQAQNLCKGKKKNREQCHYKASINGYCKIHYKDISNISKVMIT